MIAERLMYDRCSSIVSTGEVSYKDEIETTFSWRTSTARRQFSIGSPKFDPMDMSAFKLLSSFDGEIYANRCDVKLHRRGYLLNPYRDSIDNYKFSQQGDTYSVG